MKDLIAKFEIYLRFKDYSNIYLSPAKLFTDYCLDKKINIFDITFEELSWFILSKKNNSSLGYTNNFIKAIKCFYNFLKDYNYPVDSVLMELKKIKLFQVETKIKDVVTLKEIDSLVVKSVAYGYFMHPYKIKAMLYFFYYTGVRRGEFLRLKREHVDLIKMQAIIKAPTKNKVERLVYFPVKVKNILTRYFKSEPEFENAFNMTVFTIRNFFYYLKKLNPKITAHVLRHSFTDLLAEKDVDIRVAQELLGHKSFQSTLIYYRARPKRCERVYRRKIR